MRNPIPADLIAIFRVPADDANVRAARDADWSISEQEREKILDCCQSLKDYQGINPLTELCNMAVSPMNASTCNDAAPGGPPA